MDQKEFEYYAFISYSHSDEKWSKWIQRRLETYRFPSALRKKNNELPKKIFPIFRDQTDLTSGDLWDKLKQQLEESAYLIVVCSPNSAKSEYVNSEVEYYCSLGRTNRIIPVIVDGIPNAEDSTMECFCPALRNMGEKELLGVSIGELGKQKALLRMVATMMHLRFDVLVKRERARTRKRIAWSAAAFCAIAISILTSFKMIMAPERSAALANDAVYYLKNGSFFSAVEKGKQSVRELCFKKEGANGLVALRSALVAKELNDSNEKPHEVFRIELPSQECQWLGNSKDDKKIFLYDYTFVYVYSNETGLLLDQYRMTSNSKEETALAEELGWTLDNDDSFGNKSGTDLWKEQRKSEQKHKLSFDGDKLIVTGDGKTRTYKDISEEGLSYCFNADETAFAYYDAKTGVIYMEDFVSGHFRTYETLEELSLDLLMSPNGRFLFLVEYKDNSFKPWCYSFFDSSDLRSSDLVFFEEEFPGSEFSYYSFVLEKSFKNYFYINAPYTFVKYGYYDCAIEKEPTIGDYCLYSYDCTNIAFSPDESLYYYDDSPYYGIFQNENKDRVGAKSSTVCIVSKDVFASEMTFDNHLKILAHVNGDIYDLRRKKVIYKEKGGFNAVGVSKDGTKVAAMDAKGNVYLFHIDGENVEKEMIFSFDEIGEKTPESVGYFALSNDYLMIQTAEEIIYYSTSDKTVKKTESYEGILPDAFPTCQFEQDGLFFLLYSDGGLDMFDPEQQKWMGYDSQGVDASGVAGLAPIVYSEEAHLLCGSELSNQQQWNPEYSVYEYKNKEFLKLYSFFASSEIVPRFSNDGKYIILNYGVQGACRSRVLDAKTGVEIMNIPNHMITIVNDTVYSLSVPNIPTLFPTAHLYSTNELVRISKEK